MPLAEYLGSSKTSNPSVVIQADSTRREVVRAALFDLRRSGTQMPRPIADHPKLLLVFADFETPKVVRDCFDNYDGCRSVAIACVAINVV